MENCNNQTNGNLNMPLWDNVIPSNIKRRNKSNRRGWVHMRLPTHKEGENQAVVYFVQSMRKYVLGQHGFLFEKCNVCVAEKCLMQ